MISSRRASGAMIETQALVTKPAPSAEGRRTQRPAGTASYGALEQQLVGEALLHTDDRSAPSAFSNAKRASHGFAAHGPSGAARPQAMERSAPGPPPPPQRGEYQLPLQKFPVQQPSAPPPPGAGLPPAIPLRRRLDSASSDRSLGELSRSGRSRRRLRRAASDGAPLGPLPPAPPPRAPDPPLPLPHRRARSTDGPPRGHLRRDSSCDSVGSLGSAGSLSSEAVRRLPDPRWGGGSGGGRARTFSGGSGGRPNPPWSGPDVGHSYSSDSLEVSQEGGPPRGSGSDGREVIVRLGARGAAPGGRGHRRTHSELSASSFGTAASVDRSAEPVMTDMRKSSMFKGLTSEGVVRMQLPKDNFRLLSDRDLESGRVYRRALVDDEAAYFQDYHLDPPVAVPCGACGRPDRGRRPLPPDYYVMAVDPDIYRRMLDEVAASRTPFFYCGHHADVGYPSIRIALAGVAVLFAIMLWVASCVGG